MIEPPNRNEIRSGYCLSRACRCDREFFGVFLGVLVGGFWVCYFFIFVKNKRSGTVDLALLILLCTQKWRARRNRSVTETGEREAVAEPTGFHISLPLLKGVILHCFSCHCPIANSPSAGGFPPVTELANWESLVGEILMRALQLGFSRPPWAGVSRPLCVCGAWLLFAVHYTAVVFLGMQGFDEGIRWACCGR